jgi:hypothetical protein
MFVRFRQGQYRLQLSLVETRRVAGKVRHEHIASLGSIGDPPSTGGRVAFWRRLHERLAKLGNRIDPAILGKILGDVHARVPMVTLEEMQALKLEGAEAHERFWSGVRDMHEGTAEGRKVLVATVERTIATSQAAAAEAADKAAQAKDRAERLKKGEDVPGGVDKPLTRADFLKAGGFTAADLRHLEFVGSVPKDVFEEALKLYDRPWNGRRDRRDLRTAIHSVMKKRQSQPTGDS